MVENVSFEFLLAIPLLAWVIVCIGGFVPAYMLSKAKFSKVENPIPIFERSISVIDPNWIKSTNFKAQYAIRAMGIPMAVFTNATNTVSMAVYFVGDQRVLDFYTAFPGKVSLTTSSTIDGPTLPYPIGGMCQSFPQVDPDEIYSRHLSAIEFVGKQTGVSAVAIKNVGEEISTFVKRQVGYILSRPWLILTIAYRLLVLRHTRKNLTISQQFNNGTLNLEIITALVNNTVK